jgi:O-antigen/teichoic acid export membrane protein
VFGLALTVVGALRYVGDLGVTYRLEALPRIDDEDRRRGLAIGLTTAAIGGLLISVIWQLLPLVRSGPAGSRFIVPVLALALVIAAPGGPATAVLNRRLAFRTVATAGLISSLALVVIQIPLLLIGVGIWALVIAYVAASMVNVVYLVVAAHGVLLPSFRGPVFRSIRLSLPYQAPLLAQAAVGLIVSALVASLLGATGIGLFSWSSILATPVVTVVFTLEAVVYPSLARMLRDDGDQYQQATHVVLLTFAALAATAAGAYVGLVPSIVRYIFAPRWLPATGAVQLALVGVVPLSLVAGCASIVNSQGRPARRLRASLAAGATATILTVPLALAAGVTGAAIVAYVISPTVEVLVLASQARARLGHLALRIARIALPLSALSFALERAVSSPASFALAVLIAGVAAPGVLATAERELVRTLWRQIRDRPPAVV